MHDCSKVGKSGDNILEQIRLIQISENCIVKTKDENMVLKKGNFLVCKNYCDNCFTSDGVCENCSIKGQTQVKPTLRACDYCLKKTFVVLGGLF